MNRERFDLSEIRRKSEELFNSGSHIEAVQLLMSAQSLQPTSSGLMNDLGVIFAQTGMGELGVAYLQRAVYLDKNDGDAKANLEAMKGLTVRTGRDSDGVMRELNGKTIVFIAENLYPAFGGAEKSAVTLLKFLRKQGFAVKGICRGEKVDLFVRDGIEYTIVEGADKIESAAEKCGGDIILTQLNWVPQAVNTAGILKIPAFIFVRSYEHFCQDPMKLIYCDGKCGVCITEKEKLRVRSEHLSAFKKADKIFSNSAFMNYFQKQFSEKEGEVLYPFINFEDCQPPMRDPYFVGLARATEAKGLLLTLEIAKRMPNVTFLAFGEHGILPMEMPKNVVVWGPGDVRIPYSKVKLLLVPSQWPEPFGRVVLEAMANGIPVIASKTGGLMEAGGEAAMYVERFWKPDKWVEPIARMLSDKDTYDDYVQKGFRRVEEFKQNRGLDNFLKIVSSTLGLPNADIEAPVLVTNYTSKTELKTTASGKGEKAGCLHIKTPYYLPLSETFIYNYLRNIGNYFNYILCHEVRNEEVFPLEAEKILFKSALTTREFSIFLRELKDKYNLRIIHAHFGHVAAETVEASKAAGLPLIASFYGKDASTYLQDPFWKDRFRELFVYAEKITALSANMRQALVKAGCPAEKIEIVHLGVDLQDYHFKARKLFPQESLKLLGVGRLVEKKGFDDAIRAIAIAVKEIKCELRIIGEGEEEAKLRKLAKELGVEKQVHFLGGQPVQYVIEEMSVCHLFIAPSKTGSDGDMEGTPTVLMEAQACGIPVISTFHAGIPETVENNITGILVEEGNTGALAEAIFRMACEWERWEEMGRAGRRKVEAEFNAKTETGKLEKLYDVLTKRVNSGTVRTAAKPEIPTEVKKNLHKRAYRIAVDSSALEDKATRVRGIGRYMYNHFMELIKITPEWDYTIYGLHDKPDVEELLDLSHFNNCHYKNWNKFSESKFDLMYLPHPMGPYSRQIIKYTAAYRIPTACTFHDLIPLIFPDLYLLPDALFKAIYFEQLAMVKNNCGLYLCNSQCTADDLNKFLDVHYNDLKVIYAGAPSKFTEIPPEAAIAETLDKFGLKREKFLIFPGVPDQRKNAVGMMSGLKYALEQIKGDLKLAIVGGLDPLSIETVKNIMGKLGLPEERVTMTGYVTDEELNALYHSGLALLFPSLYEGFGLPVIEANSAGLPVITGNNSSLKEVGGGAVYFVEAKDARSIAQGILEIYNRPELRTELREKGKTNYRRFSWEETAVKTAEYLDDFLKG